MRSYIFEKRFLFLHFYIPSFIEFNNKNKLY